MGLELSSGGHLSHGFHTPKRKVTAASQVYKCISYKVNSSGLLDYDAIQQQAKQELPQLIICGASAYSRDWDYKRFREIANECGAVLMADIAHTSGFIATGILNNPFEMCDIVTTTTHKTLRGPRSAIVFYRKKFETLINDAVFPGLQGGPHMNQIAAVAVQLAEVQTPAFREYMHQVQKNARTLAEALRSFGYTIVTGGTENHMFLVDLRDKGIHGAEAETRLSAVGISVNKNTIPGDTSALKPSGIRIGLAAMTTRGYKESDMKTIAEKIHNTLAFHFK
jgi:glycine hydroxymethyltransferase